MNENRALNFEGQDIFIGIDVHKSQWTICLYYNHMKLKSLSIDPKPEVLHTFLQRNYPGATYHSCYEAGFSGFWAHRELIDLGINNIVINAADVPTSHKEKDRKKDPVDARKLGRELCNQSLEAIYIPSTKMEQFRSLTRLRRSCQIHMTRLKNRISQFLHYYGLHIPLDLQNSRWSKRFLLWLEGLSERSAGLDSLAFMVEEFRDHRTRMSLLIRKIREHIKAIDEDEIVSYLLTIPGIGATTAITLYSELMDINRFKTVDNLYSYLGFIASEEGSGDKTKVKGLTNRCNKHLRYLLVEASWVAIRKDPALLACFARYQRRMDKNLAILRIAKKLISRIRYVWKNEEPYKLLVVQ